MSDPRATTNLDDVESWPFKDGVDEITIRVVRYKDDLETPACFQAIVKPRDRHKAWSVGILANPVQALHRAISDFYENPVREWPNGEEQGLKREPLRDAATEVEIDEEDLLGD